eukprot:CAMPEP_0115322674 /NCGR_PEP_ID=MMETSP0270-20121206/81528_1 /TAXON_ID=71861 /ORGANISM="Scrippsiella trochoidea, Strain CCMP3099" /LENGTH=66 /DNA_ID=CAMNT_0002742655 /DNA_START=69 /DNA_END=266 /DNA_ORIENTATION=-
MARLHGRSGVGRVLQQSEGPPPYGRANHLRRGNHVTAFERDVFAPLQPAEHRAFWDTQLPHTGHVE